MRTWVEKLGKKLKEATILNHGTLYFDTKRISIDEYNQDKLYILENMEFDSYSHTIIRIYQEEYDYLKEIFDFKYKEKQQTLIKEFESYE